MLLAYFRRDLRLKYFLVFQKRFKVFMIIYFELGPAIKD
jgi:hypothetical protein